MSTEVKPETTVATEVPAPTKDALQKAVADLTGLLHSQIAHAFSISSLIELDTFKNLSKAGRNELLQSLLKQGGQIKDASKELFTLAKHVKREHLSDEAADNALFAQADRYN